MTKPIIEVIDLHKTYDNGTKALKGLNLTINEGEFFALLGPNGSGKTTFISTMAGSVKKTSGQIKIAGLDITKHREETKMMIGVVPQEVHFDSFFSVNEVLNLQSGYYGIQNNQKWIDEILQHLGLFDKKFTNTRALSGGMKRRLLIAKALVHKPKILVLDEPTAGVDVELRHSLWKYVKKLNKDGFTILLTTHYLEEAESLCNRTAIISKGDLIAIDKTKTLIKSLGEHKKLKLSFQEDIKQIPEALKKFNAKKVLDNEILLEFQAKDTNAVLRALESCQLPILDMDLKSQNLEDVFVELTHKKNG